LIKISNNAIVFVKQPHCFNETTALFGQNNGIVSLFYQGKILQSQDKKLLNGISFRLNLKRSLLGL